MLEPKACDEWFVSEQDGLSGPLPGRRIDDLIRWGKVSERAFVTDAYCSAWIPIRKSAFASAMAERLGQRTSGRAPAPSALARPLVRSGRGTLGLLMAVVLLISVAVAALTA